MNPPQIDSVFSLLNHEVWIVTADVGKNAGDLPQSRGGLVATWAGPASIDSARPVAMVAVAVNHYTRLLIERSGAFGLHLITADQLDFVRRFALSSGRDEDKLAGLPFRQEETGSPILERCLGWLDCRVFHAYTTGDRRYFWGDVVAGDQQGVGEPLRVQELFASADESLAVQLFERMKADLVVQRPLYAEWRDSLPAK